MLPSPGPPGWFYLSVKHLGWTGTKGGARGSVTGGVFLGSGMFSVRSSFCADFQREAVIPETGKCYKQYGNTWPLLELLELPPPPALLPSAAACCQERIHITVRVCLCLFVEQNTLNQPLVEIWLCRCDLCIFPLRCPLITVLQRKCKCFISHLQLQQQSPISKRQIIISRITRLWKFGGGKPFWRVCIGGFSCLICVSHLTVITSLCCCLLTYLSRVRTQWGGRKWKHMFAVALSKKSNHNS